MVLGPKPRCVGYLDGDIVAIRKVQASPPKAPCSNRVSLESL
jgi:hypothetical protein